ncbi:MAG: potassium transporter TrkA [Cycloclasticus sp. symbiont of Poecilosclerida sp. M]|nr:MAG: potassium transporter TrkA [Cycloclasticus sp. symbiont of Poecilosclerida sp. M]
MDTDQVTIFIILSATLVLFAWGKLRYDIVALAAMSAVLLSGLVTDEEAFAGFGHTAVITVAAVLIISQALKNAGVVDVVANYLIPHTKNALLHVGLLTIIVTFFSAFMNNVGALALLLPVAIATAKEHDRSPAMVLMPIAFGSILGGMTTMIGTPPNIIIASYRADITGEAFGMFDFSPVGFYIALGGVIFITLIGWRLIPRERFKENAPEQLFEVGEYLTEVKVLEGSTFISQAVCKIDELQNEDIGVVGITRGNNRALDTNPNYEVKQDDILILRGELLTLQKKLSDAKLEFQTASGKTFDALTSDDLVLTECVISATSPFANRDVSYLRRRTANAAAVIGLAHEGRMLRKRLRNHTFKAGDILLLQCEKDYVNDMLSEFSLLPLAKRGIQIGQQRRVLAALAIFVAAICLGAFHVLPMAGAFILAILAYSIFGFLPGKDVYRDVDWPIIILLGGMIPVGRALESTGATDLIANSIIGITEGLPIYLILTLILVVTMFLSDIINNAATALVMAPISVGIANQLGVNIDPFLMAVAVGASCAFLTPIGHQSNTLVMGPGGYQFGDYWRMGLPLEIIITVISIPLILQVWPL